MLYHIEIPHIVHRDIAELSDYIYRFSLSNSISQKVYDNLYKQIFSLNFMPNRFEKYVGEYRRIVVDGNYKILYRINEEERKVIVVRVIRSEMTHVEY